MSGKTLRQAADAKGIMIGAAAIPERIEKEPAYRETLSREFNCLVAENCMKFMFLQPERGRFDFAKADKLVDFSRENRMRLRGHTLAWHNQLPAWFKEQPYEKTEALDILRDHIFHVLPHFRGSVFAWDVVNEALNDEGGWRDKSPWYQMAGPEYLEQAFRWAHEADPTTQLFYNDYGMEQPNAKADACYAMLKDLLKRGVPVHGVGFQCHLGSENRLDAKSCIANISRFADLGLAVHFTEMDMGIKKPITDESRKEQAAEYANRIQIALGARVTGLIFWGFTDRYSWVPNFTKGEFDEALMFDRDYRPKLAYESILNALR
jgi:endo-1,4-beta-xylanase